MTPQPTSMETLLGASVLKVNTLDGRSLDVRIRQLPVRDMPKYLAAQDDEPAMIELVCELDSKVVDALTQDSHAALIAEIERVNCDFFVRWAQRQKARGDRLKAQFGVPG